MTNLLNFPVQSNIIPKINQMNHNDNLTELLTHAIQRTEEWGHEELRRLVAEYCRNYNIPNIYTFLVWYNESYEFLSVEIKES